MANDFSGAADCILLANMDNGFFGTDSSPAGGNNLDVRNGAVVNVVDFKQGDGSGDFEQDSNQSLRRTNTNITATFPGKSGTLNVDITQCGWVKFESIGTSYIMAKWLAASKSYVLLLIGDKPSILIGDGSTNQYNLGAAGADVVTGRWYHMAMGYRSSDDAVFLRVWDDTAGAISHNLSGTSSVVMGVGTGDFYIGSSDQASNSMDGLIDEAVVFNTYRPTSDTDAIRAGTFGAAVAGGAVNNSLLLGVG